MYGFFFVKLSLYYYIILVSLKDKLYTYTYILYIVYNGYYLSPEE